MYLIQVVNVVPAKQVYNRIQLSQTIFRLFARGKFTANTYYPVIIAFEILGEEDLWKQYRL